MEIDEQSRTLPVLGNIQGACATAAVDNRLFAGANTLVLHVVIAL